jgi:hypothetical protein
LNELKAYGKRNKGKGRVASIDDQLHQPIDRQTQAIVDWQAANQLAISRSFASTPNNITNTLGRVVPRMLDIAKEWEEVKSSSDPLTPERETMIVQALTDLVK